MLTEHTVQCCRARLNARHGASSYLFSTESKHSAALPLDFETAPRSEFHLFFFFFFFKLARLFFCFMAAVYWCSNERPSLTSHCLLLAQDLNTSLSLYFLLWWLDSELWISAGLLSEGFDVLSQLHEQCQYSTLEVCSYNYVN